MHCCVCARREHEAIVLLHAGAQSPDTPLSPGCRSVGLCRALSELCRGSACRDSVGTLSVDNCRTSVGPLSASVSLCRTNPDRLDACHMSTSVGLSGSMGRTGASLVSLRSTTHTVLTQELLTQEYRTAPSGVQDTHTGYHRITCPGTRAAQQASASAPPRSACACIPLPTQPCTARASWLGGERRTLSAPLRKNQSALRTSK